MGVAKMPPTNPASDTPINTATRLASGEMCTVWPDDHRAEEAIVDLHVHEEQHAADRRSPGPLREGEEEQRQAGEEPSDWGDETPEGGVRGKYRREWQGRSARTDKHDATLEQGGKPRSGGGPANRLIRQGAHSLHVLPPLRRNCAVDETDDARAVEQRGERNEHDPPRREEPLAG